MRRYVLVVWIGALTVGWLSTAAAADSQWGESSSESGPSEKDKAAPSETSERTESSGTRSDTSTERSDDESDDSGSSKPPETEAGTEDASTDDSNGSMSFLESPAPYTYGIGVHPGVLFWDTPYGGQETAFTVMANGHARISSPLIGSLSVGYARRAPAAGTLVVANDHITAMGGIGVEGWLQTLRLSLQAQGGVISRRLTITDGTGTTYRDSRFTPTAGGRFSLGALFSDRFLVSLASGARFFAPSRGEFYTGLEMSWLFVHSP